jgi:hypothetical protein
MAVPVAAGGLEQVLDLAGGQVLAGAQVGVLLPLRRTTDVRLFGVRLFCERELADMEVTAAARATRCRKVRRLRYPLMAFFPLRGFPCLLSFQSPPGVQTRLPNGHVAGSCARATIDPRPRSPFRSLPHASGSNSLRIHLARNRE